MYIGTINLLQIAVILVSVALLSGGLLIDSYIWCIGLEVSLLRTQMLCIGGLLKQGNVGSLSVLFVSVCLVCPFLFSPAATFGL